MDGVDTKKFCPANIALKSEVLPAGMVFLRESVYTEKEGGYGDNLKDYTGTQTM